MPHIHEKIDFVSEVFIVYNGRVLLRKHDKYGIWLGVGGHIELDEDPNEAAIREVKEEVGLDVKLVGKRTPQLTEGEDELVVPMFMNRHRPGSSPIHEHIVLIYAAKATTDIVIPEQASDEWRWFTMKEIQAKPPGIAENILFYAEAALQAVA